MLGTVSSLESSSVHPICICYPTEVFDSEIHPGQIILVDLLYPIVGAGHCDFSSLSAVIVEFSPPPKNFSCETFRVVQRDPFDAIYRLTRAIRHARCNCNDGVEETREIGSEGSNAGRFSSVPASQSNEIRWSFRFCNT